MGRELTGADGVNRASIDGPAAPCRARVGGLLAGPHQGWATPHQPS